VVRIGRQKAKGGRGRNREGKKEKKDGQGAGGNGRAKKRQSIFTLYACNYAKCAMMAFGVKLTTCLFIVVIHIYGENKVG
jgi:hypothetical protein